MNISPYLLAIQSLDGQNPRDKYKKLHSIASQIIKNDKEREEFISTGFTQRVQPAILPYLRIIVGNKLKLNNSVIEALKSDDLTINRQALNAKWFYSSSNDVIRVDYFLSHIVPYISLRTRFELLKTLGQCLINDSKKADEFFDNFADVFDVEQVLPLIIACSENFIYDTILKRKIILRYRILGILYRKYPQLVIRYLQLGNETNETNKEARKIHKISLSYYNSFLPILVKCNTQEFVELFECLPDDSKNVKLGSTRAEFFLRNATDVLIKKPRTFLNLLPLKLVSNKLSTQQFETMFENLFLKEIYKFDLLQMISYLEYYPQEKKLTLLMNKYNLIYGKDLLENTVHEYFNHNYQNFFKLIPANIKEEYGRKKYEQHSVDVYQSRFIIYLPPKESIIFLKEMINKPTMESRACWISRMFSSCAFYDSKKDLLDVLNYYKARHINEQACVLHEVLDFFFKTFDVNFLNEAHWQVLKEIIQIAYIKGHLFSNSYSFEKLFESALSHFLKQSKSESTVKNNEFLDLLVEIIVECYFEHDMTWNFLLVSPDIEMECLQKFLFVIPKKYPETIKIWDSQGIKLNITSYLIDSMNKFNARHSYTESNKRSNNSATDFKNKDVKRIKFTIRDYPWLINFTLDLLKTESNDVDCKEFRKILRNHDLEFYQNLIDNHPDIINDLESSDALAILKNSHNKILDKWERYLTVCKDRLQRGSKCVKRFVSAIKWYHEIPIKFVEQCLLEIEEKNSMLILGILLEGQAFSQIIKPYLPNDKKINPETLDSKKAYRITRSITTAIKYCNPPVSLEAITSFCQGDYVALVTNALNGMVRRVPINNVVAFVNQLIDKNISVKKIGIRMIFQVVVIDELRKFLIQLWENEKNSSIRELAANKIFELFVNSPSTESWNLLKVCFNEIILSDTADLSKLLKLQNINVNYLPMYIKEIMDNIDKLSENDQNAKKKEKLISYLVNNIDENIMHWLPEELITDIVRRNFFNLFSLFTFNIYLLPNENMFEQRLEIIMEHLSQQALLLHRPSAKSPRYFPAGNYIHNFIQLMLRALLLEKYNNEIVLRLLNRALELFSRVLHPYQQPRAFIDLHMYKTYYESNKVPKEFGLKFGKEIINFIHKFGSEVIVDDIAGCISDLLCNIKDNNINSRDLMLLVTMGLVESDKHYGSMVGIKLLHDIQIHGYNNSYDELVKIWRGIDNVTVQTLLHAALNKYSELELL